MMMIRTQTMRQRRISYFHLTVVLLIVLGVSLIGMNLIDRLVDQISKPADIEVALPSHDAEKVSEDAAVENLIPDSYEIPPSAKEILPPAVLEFFGEEAPITDDVFTLPEIRSVSGQAIIDAPKVLVLNYHKIDHTFNSLAVAPEIFEEQIIYLKNHGYQSISIDELYDGLIGETVLPDKSVLITFDDGYSDNYYNAYPILKVYGMKATVFVVPGFTSTVPGYVTWDQLREMEQNGIKIESHTMTHQKLESLTDDEIIKELTESKNALENQLGHPVEDLAYPTGTYNLHIASLAKQVGYRSAFTVKYGNSDVGSNIYALERVPIFQTENTMRDFRSRIEYRPIFEEFGWSKP